MSVFHSVCLSVMFLCVVCITDCLFEVSVHLSACLSACLFGLFCLRFSVWLYLCLSIKVSCLSLCPIFLLFAPPVFWFLSLVLLSFFSSVFPSLYPFAFRMCIRAPCLWVCACVYVNQLLFFLLRFKLTTIISNSHETIEDYLSRIFPSHL